jgi:phenylalanine-4-hydroxylase
LAITPKQYTEADKETWRLIVHRHAQTRELQVCDLFLSGVKALGINENKIPNLESLNEILFARSGFRGVLVDGLEEGKSFYRMLSERLFPVGNFIRSRQDLSYTPAPDIVHDLYGHLPFYTDRHYGDFCQAFGEAALEFADQPELLRQFERFFWFTVEFGLIKTAKGVRVFGAGIASSTGECTYALSGEPQVKPFDIDTIRYQEFRIDEMQKTLFLLESPEQLYSSLNELRHRVKQDSRGGPS